MYYKYNNNPFPKWNTQKIIQKEDRLFLIKIHSHLMKGYLVKHNTIGNDFLNI